MSKTADLKVFITSREATCDECGDELGRGAWIMLAGEKGALRLTCADLDHLVFLPSGDAALTRRSRKYSTLSAVVLQWSKASRRYKRQGLLVEEEALAQAEQECLADADARAKRNARATERRAELDREYVKRFAARVRELYPNCPPGREEAIAEHACLMYSGRVGRSAAAKQLDETAVHLAVVAHVRHNETDYDLYLAASQDRREARDRVSGVIEHVLEQWQK